MQEYPGPDGSVPMDLCSARDWPADSTKLPRLDEDLLEFPARLMTDLAVSELRLVAVFLASATAAKEHGDEPSRHKFLRKAFDVFCQACLCLLQVPRSKCNLLLSGDLANEVHQLQTQIAEAFSDR